MGDPAGIGPEIIAGAWEQLQTIPDCQCVIYGHHEVMRRAAELRKINAEINCVTCCGNDILEVPPGTIDPRSGQAAYAAILRAIDDAQKNAVDAVVTAPIHKAALHRAGHHYPGHTEIFAEQCGVGNFAMMLYLGAGENLSGQHGLAVVHVTLHTAMKTIFEQITSESVLAKIHLANGFMRQIISAADCGQTSAAVPRIGVCSLNPHAGEEGLFGDEEIRIIQPAIDRAIMEGVQVE